MRNFVKALAGFGLALLATAPAVAQHGAEAQRISLAVQATGTVKWELAAMQALGLDRKHHLELEVRDVADSRAGQIALQAGEADIILSDFVWVALQRHEGNMVAMVPHSLTVGGLLVDPAAGIDSLADLKGKTLAVSGSPVDKSYVILAADYHKLTGGNLTEDADARFGAPPLVNELLVSGQAQAALNLWNWNSRAKLAGKTELVSVADMLQDLGVSETPPLLGWAFFEDKARARKAAFEAFFDASFDTKQALLEDDAIWEQIKDMMKVDGDDALFRQLRDDYRAGIITKYASTSMQPAEESFALMAKFGGKDVVGDITEITPGTFYKGYRK
jgi:NitT/TauT family transport system substrate-binding protein